MLVEYSGVLYNLFHRGDDGMTPYMRTKGRLWRIPLPSFGESVKFMRRTKSKFDSRWERGIFLGFREATTEMIVGTSQGVFVV